MSGRFKRTRSVVLAAFLLPSLTVHADAAGREIVIAAVGDIMMGSNYPMNALPADGGNWLFDQAASILANADIAFGNLEGTLTTARYSTKDVSTGRAYAFRTPPEYAANLDAAGFDVMSLANNHSWDFGNEGLLGTERALRDHGIQFAGKDSAIAAFRIGGVSVGFIATDTTPGPRNITVPGPLLEEIGTLSSQYDILVVSIHAGAEGNSALHIRNSTEYFLGENRGNIVSFARQAIDRGADLILGHGPHVPRALEVYNDRLIAYSLGNFCNYIYFNLNGPMGVAPILEVRLGPDGAFLSGQVHSFKQIPPGAPQVDNSDGAAALIADLSRLDFPDTAPVFDAAGGFGPSGQPTTLAAAALAPGGPGAETNPLRRRDRRSAVRRKRKIGVARQSRQQKPDLPLLSTLSRGRGNSGQRAASRLM
jgi:hypothetical protein